MVSVKDRPRDPKTGRFLPTGAAKKVTKPRAAKKAPTAKTNLAIKRMGEAVRSVDTISNPSAKLARMEKANEWADKAGKKHPYSATSIKYMQKQIIALYPEPN